MNMFVVALCLLTAACAHTTSSAPASSTEAPQVAESGDSEVVCREERQVGSMISKKVCRPKSEGHGQYVDGFTRKSGQTVLRN